MRRGRAPHLEPTTTARAARLARIGVGPVTWPARASALGLAVCGTTAGLLGGAAGCGAILGVDGFTDREPTVPVGGSAGTTTTSSASGGGGTTAAGGTGGTSGAGGDGGGTCGDGTRPPGSQSCRSGAPGAGCNCGPSGTDDCCSSVVIPGGSYERAQSACYDVEIVDYLDATVSDFRLDKYEVTVGRFRAFWAEYPELSPTEGFGEHERIEGTGWQNWSKPTVTDVEALLDEPGCTWTAGGEGDETLPITCINWYVAFLFCAWDGGRLPTEAEWNYVAAGGSYEYTYPWGTTPPHSGLAVYAASGPAPVGSKPDGRQDRWGHLDMAGNVDEWCYDGRVDWGAGGGLPEHCVMPFPCQDCAELDGWARIVRGGSYASAYEYLLMTGNRAWRSVDLEHPETGFRCAHCAGCVVEN